MTRTFGKIHFSIVSFVRKTGWLPCDSRMDLIVSVTQWLWVWFLLSLTPQYSRKVKLSNLLKVLGRHSRSCLTGKERVTFATHCCHRSYNSNSCGQRKCLGIVLLNEPLSETKLTSTPETLYCCKPSAPSSSSLCKSLNTAMSMPCCGNQKMTKSVNGEFYRVERMTK